MHSFVIFPFADDCFSTDPEGNSIDRKTSNVYFSNFPAQATEPFSVPEQKLHQQ
jgi:hypothetical protein